MLCHVVGLPAKNVASWLKDSDDFSLIIASFLHEKEVSVFRKFQAVAVASLQSVSELIVEYDEVYVNSSAAL